MVYQLQNGLEDGKTNITTYMYITIYILLHITINYIYITAYVYEGIGSENGAQTNFVNNTWMYRKLGRILGNASELNSAYPIPVVRIILSLKK